jgi:hypothetical protein
VQLGLRQAYGLERPQPDLIDTTHIGDGEAADVISLLGGFSARRPVGAGLGEGFDHLVGQALQHEFPQHPELRMEPTARALSTVSTELLAAVPEQGGRREITGAPTRALLGGLAEPLGLGRQSEVAFVLGDRWPVFLTRELKQAGGTMTVGQARALLADTELAGLPAPLQNLVLLVATEQLGRRFSEHGGKATVSVARLDDHLSIVEQPLPSPEVWEAAKQRAHGILGLTPNPQRAASAVGALSEELVEHFAGFAVSVNSLPDRLALRAAALGIQEPGARALTAQAAQAFTQEVRSAGDSVARITAFATFDLPATVTDQVMGTSLTSAGHVADVLSREGWTTIEQLTLLDDKDAEAEKILSVLRTAVVDDELVVHIEPRFTTAVRDGAALIRRRLLADQDRRRIEETEKKKDGKEDKPQGTNTVVGVAAARDVLEKLTVDVPGASELHITISWTAEQS